MAARLPSDEFMELFGIIGQGDQIPFNIDLIKFSK